jgi:hypothetical protein
MLKPRPPIWVRGRRMLHIQFGNVKEGRYSELQAWIKKNEGALAKSAPAGWTYRGTFGTVLGFGKYDAAQIWEINRYGDFDTSREHDNPAWNRLNEEFVDFFLPGSNEATLLREVGDIRVVEPKKSKK